jgi:type I restriction-modification system DNA methylase subunit
MAALLLSLIDEVPPNIDAPPSVLIDEINSRAKRILKKESKGAFYSFIEISLPPTEDNHVKYKKALVSTIQELNNLNIRSAMNSGTDVLGVFYEVFLRYGNGAKEIGIVLTPRHITEWAVEVMQINKSDFLYDPTCGTGGFLVAAFDRVRKNSTEKQLEEFKKHHLFGIEQEPEVVALAIVNMIFRGDGKNNIEEGNCFQKNVVKSIKNGILTADYSRNEGEKIVNKILMNPPFALENDEKEYKFVQHALDQMDYGGILFSVLPVSVMFESGEEKEWRKNKLLKENTLISVITFPPELFYPIGAHTIGIFIKKGIPHNESQKVLWARAIHDGLLKKKGKRLLPESDEPDDLKTFLPKITQFINNQSVTLQDVPEYCKIAPIDFSDPLLELVPEAYIDSKPIIQEDIQEGIENLVRETAALLIRYGKEKVAK